MYEEKQHKVASRAVYIRRILFYIFLATLLTGLTLSIGTAGYHWIAGLSWDDSLLEASMILGRMGPVLPINKTTAKIFFRLCSFQRVGFYCSGGDCLAPVVHLMLHKFHVDDSGI